MKIYSKLIALANAHHVYAIYDGGNTYYFSNDGYRISPRFTMGHDEDISDNLAVIDWMKDNLSDSKLIHNTLQMTKKPLRRRW